MLEQYLVDNITRELATPIETTPAYITAHRVLDAYKRTNDANALRSYKQMMGILTGGRAYRAGLLAAHYAELAAAAA